MKTYMVTITETMQKTVEVEANSREEAERVVEQRWNDSEYAPGHLVRVDFSARATERSRDHERRKEFSIMSEEKKIKVVLLEPGKLARTAEIDASLAGMQKVVGGLIEPFYPFEEQVCIVCNEESKINGMRPNRSVKNDDGVMVDFIFGPAFICDCRGENLDSLSDEQIDRYGKMFRYPEHLARVNDTLLGIPYRPQPERER